jgi:hypothetical protein
VPLSAISQEQGYERAPDATAADTSQCCGCTRRSRLHRRGKTRELPTPPMGNGPRFYRGQRVPIIRIANRRTIVRTRSPVRVSNGLVLKATAGCSRLQCSSSKPASNGEWRGEALCGVRIGSSALTLRLAMPTKLARGS